jgi:hypothetical protein
MCGVRRGVLQQAAVRERLVTRRLGKGWTLGPCGGAMP